jgi:acetyl esterase
MDEADIHPQAREVLERRRKLGLTSLRDVGVRRLRWLNRLVNWWQNRNPPAVGRTVDRTIPGPDGDLPVRLYRPHGDGPFPTVVFFHGVHESFALVQPIRNLRFLRTAVLCWVVWRATTCSAATSPASPAPSWWRWTTDSRPNTPSRRPSRTPMPPVEWTAANPGALASDGHLAVVGDSAGGTLAAVAALMAAEKGGPEIDYQYLLYPGVGVEPDQQSVREYAGLVLSEDDLQWFRECYYGSEVHERNPYADPTNACDRSGVAPATVLTAGFDPLRDGGAAYAGQLEADGVPVRRVEYDDMIHGFATMLSSPDLDRAHEAVADVASDVRRAFTPA